MKMHNIHFENIYSRFIYFFILFNGLFLTTAFGQNIPDDRFAEAIRAVCPTCIDNANNLLPPATSLIELDVRGKNISLLTGVEGFTSLQNLFCSSNSIINVPTLPSTLKVFSISLNSISSLPTLPSNLEKLYCANNTLTSLPTLPSSLVELYIQNNQVTTLPTLPSSLIELDVDNNRLTSLPTLPSSLWILYAGGNQLTTLPSLPNSLQYFSCWSNQITALPTTLPSGLIDLTCQNNPLSSLPILPSTLSFLGCYGTAINCLPTLPAGLTTLQIDPTRILCLPNTPTNCKINNGANTTDIRSSFSVCGPKITDVNFANAIRAACPTCIDGCNNLAPAAASLTTLDVNSKNIVSLAGLEGFTHLETLSCYNNPLSSLPTLPSTLKVLYCGFSNLTSLPTLPNSLQQLLCPNSQLASLPTLPSGLLQLYVDNNRFTSLPALPNGLRILYTGGNQLTTLPTLPSSLTNFSCWSNQITALPSTLPIGLLELGVYNNPLSNLPDLPSTLQHLSCYATNITCLPTLPTTLTALLLDPTKITCLPNIPTNLAVYNGAGTTNIRNTFSFCAPPNIVIHPSVTNPVCVGNTVTLTANATSTKPMTVKWQLKRSTDANYIDLTTATNYTSGTDATYDLTFTANDNGAFVRAVFSIPCLEWETNAAPIFLSNGIHVPDANFAAAIRSICPTCINACNDLTSDAGTVTSLDVSFKSISDLTGLEGFMNLENLNCEGNINVSFLPNLPTNLQTIYCNSNKLTSLPTLPGGLTELRCTDNELTSLPSLPNSLQTVFLSNNKLTSLPTLPSGLLEIRCENNQLTSLPALNNNLLRLFCNGNQLTSLPTLPNGMQLLYCNSNALSALPTLPSSLQYLYCGNNQLTSIPTLPNGLLQLSCYGNALRTLPTLPNTMWLLDCMNCQLTQLPTLPANLRNLYCYQNDIHCLPTLPNSVFEIGLDAAKITCLPNIPTSLGGIYDQDGVLHPNIISNYGLCTTTLITVHPSVTNPVCIGSVVTLTAQVVGNNGMTIRWQGKRATDVNYVETVAPRTYVSGTVANVQIVIENASNGNSYRAVFTTCSGELITNATIFTVSTGLHIPNANFATAIRNQCANCIDNCDNLTLNAASLTSLNVSSAQISDLTGIEGFTSLQSFYCNYNSLTSLPNNLPSGLTTLSCTNTLINTLPTLPSGLTALYCGGTFINTLPTLPNTLRTLDCSNAYLMALPSVLPSGLLTLNCSSNQLTSLPDLPTTLLELNCNSNALTSLPPFYNKIQYLYCQNNQLTSLPSSLPADLKYLRCQNNRLTDLPSSLTPNILEIECYDNNIYCLPTLPNALTNLKLDKLKITCLPNTVAGLVIQNRDIAGDISGDYALCTAPSVMTHPSVSGNPQSGQTTSFTAKAINNSATTVKWQRKGASDANFSDIANSEVPYTTNTDATFTANLTNTDVGASYRAVFTSQCSGDVTTNALTLSFTVLPVELTTFSGKTFEEYNALTWSIATQRNASHFIVERRGNDAKNWTAIGQVAVQSNSDYQFDDQQPLPLAYYRLAAVDLDGSVSYSKTISIDRQALKNPKIKVYPNPATSDLTIEILSNTEGVEIINGIGQVVFKEKTTSKNEVHIDINTWQSGVYFIKTTGATTLVKFIKN